MEPKDKIAATFSAPFTVGRSVSSKPIQVDPCFTSTVSYHHDACACCGAEGKSGEECGEGHICLNIHLGIPCSNPAGRYGAMGDLCNRIRFLIHDRDQYKRLYEESLRQQQQRVVTRHQITRTEELCLPDDFRGETVTLKSGRKIRR